MGPLQCGDLNGNGNVTVADVVILLNVLNGNPTLFPPCEGSEPPLACGSTLSGNITQNLRIQKCGGARPNCSAFVSGTTFVQPGVTLTFDPGSTVCGRKVAPTPSTLVFLRDAKINAPARRATRSSSRAISPKARRRSATGAVSSSTAAAP
jgi:hypothetical protein